MTTKASKSLFVVGASGSTGKRVVEAALAAGAWKVTAFVRTPSKIPDALRSNPSLTVVVGDVNDASGVKAAVVSAKPDAHRRDEQHPNSAQGRGAQQREPARLLLGGCGGARV